MAHGLRRGEAEVAQGRRQQIVAAARELAAEEGLRALSVRRVAERAGIGASTLRHHFPTQRHLYDAVVAASLDEQVDDLAIADRTRPPAERLTACLAQFLPADDARIPELGAWLALYRPLMDADASGTELLASLTRRGRSRVEGWLAQLDAEGALRPVERGQLLATVLAVVDGLCLDLLAPEGVTTVAEARAILGDVVERTVVADTGGAS